MDNLFFDSLKYTKRIFLQVIPVNTYERINNNSSLKMYIPKFLIWKINDFLKVDIYTENEEDFERLNDFLYEQLRYAFADVSSAKFEFMLNEQEKKKIVLECKELLDIFNVHMTENRTNITSLSIKNIHFCIDDKIIECESCDSFLSRERLLTAEEMCFIDDIMEKQNSENWFFPSKKPKKPIIANSIIPKKEPNKKDLKNKTTTVESSVSADSDIEYASLKKIPGSENPEKDINEMIGLEKIKRDIEKLKYKLEYNEERRKRGIDTESSTMHMVFTGNPGTGKTTVARILTGILYNLKYIRVNQCIEVSGLDLVGGFVGQTAIKTKKIIDEAKGGILFIDEAYALCDGKGSGGKEAISVLLKEMEDHRQDLIVIFAGYEQNMDNFININPGFRSRINKYFDFEDYSLNELLCIFTNQIQKKHLKIEREPLILVAETLKRAREHANFSNGRFVRNLVEQVEESHILNTVGVNDYHSLDTISRADVSPETMQLLLKGI